MLLLTVLFFKEQRNKNGTVWYCITVPFFHKEQRNKNGTVWYCITVPFLYMELRNSFVFCTTVPCEKRNSVALYHCSEFS